VTVTVVPAMVSVPVRALVVLFAATVTPTVPSPDPLAPAVTVIHGTFDTAVHAQPAGAVTRRLVAPPAVCVERLVGVPANEQGTAACVTGTFCPAIVNVPLRGLVTLLGSIEIVTAPLPEPLVPVFTVIQGTLETALQLQPAGAVTVIVRASPPYGLDTEAGATT